MEPPPDVLAGRPATCEHLVMAASTAQIACPARAARLLAVDVAVCEPLCLPVTIDACVEAPHRACRVPNETMAGRQLAVRGDAEISRPRPAGVGAVCAAVNLPHRGDHVCERVSLAQDNSSFKLTP